MYPPAGYENQGYYAEDSYRSMGPQSGYSNDNNPAVGPGFERFSMPNAPSMGPPMPMGEPGGFVFDRPGQMGQSYPSLPPRDRPRPDSGPFSAPYGYPPMSAPQYSAPYPPPQRPCNMNMGPMGLAGPASRQGWQGPGNGSAPELGYRPQGMGGYRPPMSGPPSSVASSSVPNSGPASAVPPSAAPPSSRPSSSIPPSSGPSGPRPSQYRPQSGGMGQPPAATGSRGMYWSQMDSQKQLPHDALRVGTNKAEGVFVGRSKGQVGMVVASKGGLVTVHDGKAQLHRGYEVLCGPESRICWVTAKGKFEPGKSRPLACANNGVFAGRTQQRGHDYVGHVGGKGLVYLRRGSEEHAKRYQVLCEID
ncbi:hypothetical protein GGI25_003847 [Coemansia spiralis]|uniref:Uncharacterized protein n=2 Tax=Coemansia TaxID=4863 RepID=A0A9W8KXQ9_9FUNG|nr:hypothetical protein BX070DRAFT_224492 [Coemansia spiralis]KAJ1990994.1 hypothetical protein EDC05_003714 [Coemansia umbellata]KAJ2621004.1 hypothetical protein GGI26_004504 [Coemansia sp. RSA 1358]KAJ2675753.1 hypothetical protein GGI25_003847 [Coemansia spiralis]